MIEIKTQTISHSRLLFLERPLEKDEMIGLAITIASTRNYVHFSCPSKTHLSVHVKPSQ
jgi:hypothetical protein